MYTAQVLKQRQSVGKRTTTRTINDNPSLTQGAMTASNVGSPSNAGSIVKTIELSQTISAENTQSQEGMQSVVSKNYQSKQSVSVVSQNSLQKKHVRSPSTNV